MDGKDQQRVCTINICRNELKERVLTFASALAGKVWVAGSILMLICAFLPVAGTIWIAFCIMLVLVVLPTLYSYLYSRKYNE
jgi:hypothetical protein